MLIYYLNNYKKNNNSESLINVKYSLFINYIKYILALFGTFFEQIFFDNYEIEFVLKEKDKLVDFMFFFSHHMNCLYKILIDIAVSDNPGQHNRFKIYYLLLNVHYNVRIKVIIYVDDLSNVPSLYNIFLASNWLEREAWDMFGIFFVGHPDLRRILTDYGFDGYPLRKDFPLSGYSEIFFDDTKKAIVYEPVTLAQEYRNFEFINPWGVY